MGGEQRLPRSDKGAPVAQGELVEVGIAYVVGSLVVEIPILQRHADHLELVDLPLPFRGDSGDVAEIVLIHVERRVERAHPVQVVFPQQRHAAGGGKSQEIELRLETAVIQLAFGSEAAEHRPARRHRMRDLPAGSEMGEGGALLHTCLGYRDEAEGGQDDIRAADATVDVAVITESSLDEEIRGGAEARFARADCVQKPVNHGLHGGRRLEASDRLEFLARPRLLSEHEIAAGEFETGLRVLGEVEDVALECKNPLAGVPGVDCGYSEEEVERRIAELVGILPAVLVRRPRFAFLQQRLDLIGGCRQHAFRDGHPAQADSQRYHPQCMHISPLRSDHIAGTGIACANYVTLAATSH